MKAIDLSTARPTLTQLLDLAGEENVILRTREGRQFVLAEIDDFADEVAKASQNAELMELLHERSLDTTQIPLDEVRARLRRSTWVARKGHHK